MAALLSHPPDSGTVECLPHKTWTRSEVTVLESTGLFDGTHFELIEGELIDKMGKSRRHVRSVRTLEAHAGADRIEQEAAIDPAPGDNAETSQSPMSWC